MGRRKHDRDTRAAIADAFDGQGLSAAQVVALAGAGQLKHEGRVLPPFELSPNTVRTYAYQARKRRPPAPAVEPEPTVPEPVVEIAEPDPEPEGLIARLARLEDVPSEPSPSPDDTPPAPAQTTQTTAPPPGLPAGLLHAPHNRSTQPPEPELTRHERVEQMLAELKALTPLREPPLHEQLLAAHAAQQASARGHAGGAPPRPPYHVSLLLPPWPRHRH